MKNITFYYRHGGEEVLRVTDVDAQWVVEAAEKNLSGSAYAEQSVTVDESRPATWKGSSRITVRLADVRSFRVYTPDEPVGEPS